MLIYWFILSAVYALGFFFCYADWIWFHLLPPAVQWGVFAAALPIGAAWLTWAFHRDRRATRWCWAVVTGVYLLWLPAAVFASNSLGLAVLRAKLAMAGMAVVFVLGLLWTMWCLENVTQYCRRQRLDADRKPPKGHDPDTSAEIWNPLDAAAWFYGLSPRRWYCFFTNPMNTRYWQHKSRSQRLDQSFAGLTAYSVAFLLICLVLTSFHGCGEIYDLPGGGGKPQTVAQVVRVQKVIRKKYIVNPLSAISFNVPPIDEIKLMLEEITKHAYAIGQGEGEGAGFAGGTPDGKVRFIRLQYTGGDWDQDFGVGGDMNMLFKYGEQTKHRVAERTESRTISELKNFPIGRSPPFVFITGQRSISVSNSEVKTLREYINEKHGMLFCDNGGSRHFHNQFISLMNKIEPEIRPVPIPLDDVIHRVPNAIPFLPYVAPHGGKEALGWWKDGRWICYYHPGDISDAWADGNAGVDPEIWKACYHLGTNVIFYAHAEYSKWKQAMEKNK